MDGDVAVVGTDDEGAAYVFDLNADSVPNRPPSVTMDVTCEELTCAADAVASSDPEGSISSYEWDWGDGGSKGSGVGPSHTYDSEGVYTITLTATDNDGATNRTAQEVTVRDFGDVIDVRTIRNTTVGSAPRLMFAVEEINLSADDVTLRYGREASGPSQEEASISRTPDGVFVAEFNTQHKVGRITYTIKINLDGSSLLRTEGDLVVQPIVEDLGDLVAVRYGATQILQENLPSFLARETAGQAFAQGAETASSELLVRLGEVQNTSASASTLLGKFLGLGVGVIGHSELANPPTEVEAYVTTADDEGLKEKVTVAPGGEVFHVFAVTLGTETFDKVEVEMKEASVAPQYEPVWSFKNDWGDWHADLPAAGTQSAYFVRQPVPSDRLRVDEDGEVLYTLRTTIPGTTDGSDQARILVREHSVQPGPGVFLVFAVVAAAIWYGRCGRDPR